MSDFQLVIRQPNVPEGNRSGGRGRDDRWTSRGNAGRTPGPKTDEVPVGVSARAGGVHETVALYVPGDTEVVPENETLPYAAAVTIELDGPPDADFDLSVNEGTTTPVSPRNYVYAAIGPDSQEYATIRNPDASTPLQIDVDAYTGSGSYDRTITEYE